VHDFPPRDAHGTHTISGALEVVCHFHRGDLRRGKEPSVQGASAHCVYLQAAPFLVEGCLLKVTLALNYALCLFTSRTVLGGGVSAQGNIGPQLCTTNLESFSVEKPLIRLALAPKPKEKVHFRLQALHIKNFKA
jgi:hypothetical protein